MSRSGRVRSPTRCTAETLWWVPAGAAFVALLSAGPSNALPSGSAAAAESLSLCEQADSLSGDQRAAALARGMSLAEGAIEADERDALAHFATVCNLGKQMEAEGLSIGQLFSLRRLRREVDKTLELVPDDADALAAKGVLLLRLPRFFGGDEEEAERLFRRALRSEPDNGTARCYLAKVLQARGAKEEARALAPHC